MASAQEYAQWIVDNQDKQGTDEFETVAQAYEMSKQTTSVTEPQPSPSITPEQVDVADAALLAVPALAAVAPYVPEAVSGAYQTGKALATPAASAALNLGKTYLTSPGALVTDIAMGAMGLPPPVAAEQSYKGVKGTYDTAKDFISKQGQFAPKTPAPVATPVIPQSTAPFAGAANTLTAEQIAKNPMLTEMAARGTGAPAVGPTAAPAESLASRIGSKFAPIAQRVAPVLQGAGQLLNTATPAMTFALPYQMAGAEQEKIRANPTAPEYANNPYAMQQRGQAPTQGAAGAMNRRATVANQQYGGLSAQEQAALEQDRLNQMIRRAAAKKALAFPNQ